MDSKGVPVSNFMFQPPLYKQRYLKVLDLLSSKQPKKVVDFGCAECKFMELACREPYIEELIGVDIDLDKLEKSKNKFEPLITDYINLRVRPLTVKLYQGSVHKPSIQLAECDAAVCIELIEHLFPLNLRVFSKNLFGILKPNLVVLSTPNADFNILFNLNNKLRHWDHKFEWSKAQFQDWCHIICKKYGYLVQFTGVGEPPPGHLHLGQCSQVAVFEREKFSTICQNNFGMKTYSLVVETTYPCLDIMRYHSDQLLSNIKKVTKIVVAACFKESDKLKTNYTDHWIGKLNTSFNNCRNNTATRTNIETRVFNASDGQFSDYENDLDRPVFTNKIGFQNFNTYMKTASTLGHNKAVYSKLMQKVKLVNKKTPEKHQFDNPVMGILFTYAPHATIFSNVFKLPFLFDLNHASEPGCQPNMMNFCQSTTTIPILLFAKLFQFECGYHDLIMLIKTETINGISMDCEKQVTIANACFWDDSYEEFSSECSSGMYKQSVWNEVTEEDWDI